MPAQKRVVKRKVNRIASGVPGLDPLIEGGFKTDSVNLVVGEPGAGKTIFAMQFLIEGFKRGESGIYITFEEKKRKLYDDFLSFGWDLSKYEKQGLFKFLSYTPEKVRQLLVEGGGVLDAIFEKKKYSRLVIDSITSFSLLYEDELEKKEAALALFDLIDKWKCTSILTSQAEGVEHETVMKAALDFEVDGILVLYHAKQRGVRLRALEILKMRGTKIPNKTYGFDIGKKGLIVSKRAVRV